MIHWNPSVPGGYKMTGKGRLNYFIDCGLIITFLLAFITGVIKIPELTRYFGDVYLTVSASTLSKIHDISGIVMGLLVLAHLIMHGRWIVAMTKATFGKKEP
jgi:cytochrome b subunit of formate dehydrogenase